MKNRKTKGCEIYSNSKTKIPVQGQRCRSGVFIINFKLNSHLFLVFLLLPWNMEMFAGHILKESSKAKVVFEASHIIK